MGWLLKQLPGSREIQTKATLGTKKFSVRMLAITVSYSATTKCCLQSYIQRCHLSKPPLLTVPNCNYRAIDKKVFTNSSHTTLTKMSCNFEGCSYKTRFNNNLKAHVLNCHTLKRRKDVECPLCPKKIYSTSKMEGHFMSHTKEKPCKCSLCVACKPSP